MTDPNPKVGDILSCSWGYNTRRYVGFYKVIRVTPSGKSVTVQRLQSDCIEGHPSMGYVMPTQNPHPLDNEIHKNKRIRPYGFEGDYCFNLSNHQLVTVWDGSKQYFNRMD